MTIEFLHPLDSVVQQSSQSKWDSRFLDLASLIASWSKDPSTQTGAVIVRPDRTIASVGYNGFPRGTNDAPELYADREIKYSRVVHCEMNAILSAKEPLRGYTLYTVPFCSCDRCAAHVIQAGITRAVAPKLPTRLQERWGKSVEFTKSLFGEAGVELIEVDYETFDYRHQPGRIPAHQEELGLGQAGDVGC